MRNQSQVQQSPDHFRGIPLFSVMTDRHEAAIEKLKTAFDQERSVALLIGDGVIETSHVISAFHGGLPDSATFVRLKHPHADALTAMQHINRDLGFEPSDLCLSDLQKILVMFLQYQRQHNNRTVLCIEQADDQALWLLDAFASLVSSEELEDCGLLLVLTGSPSLDGMLGDSSLGSICSYAGRPIRLPPFTLPETREFVRQRVESTGSNDVSRVFDFEAVARLHGLSGGKSDTVAQLCHESLLLAKLDDKRAVTSNTVTKAALGLHLEAAVDTPNPVVSSPTPEKCAESDEVLVIRQHGEAIQELPLENGRYMVGRAAFSDIVLPSLKVSRRHAIIIKTAEFLQVLDLGSTNGTFVRGQQIKEFIVGAGDILKMGDCEIECLAGT
ncbi:MAG: FHA domain-containing protein [Woeseiaceae bacterium]